MTGNAKIWLASKVQEHLSFSLQTHTQNNLVQPHNYSVKISDIYSSDFFLIFHKYCRPLLPLSKSFQTLCSCLNMKHRELASSSTVRRGKMCVCSSHHAAFLLSNLADPSSTLSTQRAVFWKRVNSTPKLFLQHPPSTCVSGLNYLSGFDWINSSSPPLDQNSLLFC